MNNKFDLERFKAGECAIHGGDKLYYVGTLPNGQIVISWKYGETWAMQKWDLSEFENTTMQPREEFIVVSRISLRTSASSTFEESEDRRYNEYDNPEDYITVKIVR